MSKPLIPQGVVMTPEQLQTILEAIVKAAKEPSAEEKEKREKEEAMRKRALEENMKIVKEEMELRRRTQELCGHKKENGKSCVGGQIHSDGLIHPLCLRCGKEFTPVKPSGEYSAQGLGSGE